MQNFLAPQEDLSYQQIVDAWQMVKDNDQVADLLRSRKWSLLVPEFQGLLGQTVSIQTQDHPYTVLAVDGSQIYYDKHQGPSCYVINTGSVLLQYGQEKSSVVFDSQPILVAATESDPIDTATETVNLYREQQELKVAVEQSMHACREQQSPFLCMLDGSMIFFQINLLAEGNQRDFFAQFMSYFDELYQHRILHVAYMSFPRTKDLLNVLRIVAANYREDQLESTQKWYTFTDMDVAELFLEPGTRSMAFASKAPISYAYPPQLKPYFCYINVGAEIVRLEFPFWIAMDESLINSICSIVLSQAQKGRGYPVALFEAHEQAVIKSAERDFFYESIKKLYFKKSQVYKNSRKSAKKIQVPI